jgi:hypothetical protein
MVGIRAYGGYVPRYRLSRMLIIQNICSIANMGRYGN